MKHVILLSLTLTLLCTLSISAQIGISSGGTTRKFVTPPGGPGSSYNKAISIHGTKKDSGVHAEYAYLASHFPGAKPLNHSREFYTYRMYDVITFQTSAGEKRALYFQVFLNN
jgi:hypothetical protein